MKIKLSIFCIPILFCATWCLGQDTHSVDSLKAILPKAKEDSSKVELLLQISKFYLAGEPEFAIPYAIEAKALSNKLDFKRGIALSYKSIGIAYYQQGKYVEALENWNYSLEMFEQMKDLKGISNLQSNIAAIYKNQGDDSKALEYNFNSLRNAEQIGDEFRIASALINIGSVYQHKKVTYDKALEYYLRALPLSEKMEDNDLIGTIAGNIGEIYLDSGKSETALHYFQKQQRAFQSTVDISYALNYTGKAYSRMEKFDTAKQYHQMAYDSAVKMNSKLYQEQSLQGLAGVFLYQGDSIKGLATSSRMSYYKMAVSNYLKAENISKEINSSYDLKNVYAGLASAYSKLSDYKNTSKYQALLLDIKDTIYNNEADQKLAKHELNFEIEKRQGQITLLQKDKALQDISIKRQKFAKNAFLAGIGLVLIITVIIYRNYRGKIKVNKILDSQKAQIEQLVLNILPAEVARELQQDGHATPRYYESVSVLFTDFKGFTSIADSLSPQEVVAELNSCFFAFDEIVEKYKLEKIKTIGDAYMCAGGIPVKNDEHPLNIIKASLDIQKYMYEKNEQRKSEGLAPWQLRIGIHIGPLVAGVVGKNKYAYDIWGSTVNIASRMETNGEPGQVNISAATYELIKDQYDCRYRGKIYAKNIGEIDMYFVNGEKLLDAPREIEVHDLSEHLTEHL